MNRLLAILALLATLTGCQQAVTTVPTTQPTNHDKDKADVHVRTPGVNVDVQGKGSGRNVDVDVHRKDH